MHLRLPIVAGVIALAAGFAVVRAHMPTAAPFSIATPTAIGTASPSPLAGSTTPARSPIPRGSFPHRETIVVYVAGEVVHAGLYTLPGRSRADDAVKAAGGARPGADLVAINLAAPISDGDEVAVSALGVSVAPAPRRKRRRSSSYSDSGITGPGDASAPTRHRKKRRSHRRRHATTDAASADTAAGSSATASLASDGSPKAGSDGPTDLVDLNSADPTELETLPGVGPTLAERIVAFRDASGPFASPDDLLDVGGMTQGKLDTLLPFVITR